MNVPNPPLNLPIQLNFFFGNIAFITLFIAVFLYWFDFFDSRQVSKKLKNVCMIGANVSLAFLLLLRWYESGHFPLSNLYESLIGLSWGFTSVHLILVINPLELFRKINKKKVHIFKIQNKKQEKPTQKEVFGAPITLINNTTCLQSTDSSPSLAFSPGLNLYSNKSLALTIYPNQNGLSNSPTEYNIEEKIDEYSPRHSHAKANDKIGAITAPTSLLTSAFATFFLPPEITRASALIPALKSNWLTMHVTVMVASYAFLLIGSLLSITYCVYRLVSPLSNIKNKESISSNKILTHATRILNQPKNQATLGRKASIEETSFFNAQNPINYSVNKKTLESSNTLKENLVVTVPLAGPLTNTNNFNFATWLSTTSYRILGLGFPLLTIGILSGAVWANEAWGSYWSWDPKETWALITWLVFAVYFHSRYTRSADSFVPAIIASVGFIVIWICYLGVNLLGTGLHSYGWFSG